MPPLAFSANFKYLVSLPASLDPGGAFSPEYWMRELSGFTYSGGNSEFAVRDSVVDSKGNIFSIGDRTTIDSTVSPETVVYKHRNDGTEVWKCIIGFGTAGTSQCIVLDSNGNAYVSTSDGLWKIDTSGFVVWKRAFAVSPQSGPTSICIQGNFIYQLFYQTETISLTNYRYSLLMKHTLEGAYQWSRLLSSNRDNPIGATVNNVQEYQAMPCKIVCDSQGNIYVGIYSYRWSTTGVATYTQSSLVKYSPTGVFQWIRYLYKYYNNSCDVASVVVDGSDNIIIANRLYITNYQSARLQLCKFAGDGTVLWKTSAEIMVDGASSPNTSIKAQALATDSSENIYVAGSSNFKATLLKFTGEGRLIRQYVFDAAGISNMMDVAVVNDDLYLSGYNCKATTLPSTNLSRTHLFLKIPNVNPCSGFPADFPMREGVLVTASVPTSYIDNPFMTVGSSDPTINSTYVETAANQLKLTYTDDLSYTGYTFMTVRYLDCVYVDASGNMYSASSHYSPQGNIWTVSCIVKTSPTGVKLWEYTVGSFTGKDRITAMVCDSAGDLYIGGVTENGAAVIKLSQDGVALWRKKAGPSGVFITSITDIEIMPDGNICAFLGISNMSGSYPVVISFVAYYWRLNSATGAAIASLRHTISNAQYQGSDYTLPPHNTSLIIDSADTYYSVFNRPGTLQKHSKTGVVEWTLSFQSTTLRPHAVSSQGNTFIAGVVTGTTVSSFVAKVNSAGTIVWQLSLGAISADSLLIDADENVYVSSAQGLLKCSSAGSVLWNKHVLSAVMAITTDSIAIKSGAQVLKLPIADLSKFSDVGLLPAEAFPTVATTYGTYSAATVQLAADVAASIVTSSTTVPVTYSRQPVVRQFQLTPPVSPTSEASYGWFHVGFFVSTVDQSVAVSSLYTTQYVPAVNSWYGTYVGAVGSIDQLINASALISAVVVPNSWYDTYTGAGGAVDQLINASAIVDGEVAIANSWYDTFVSRDVLSSSAVGTTVLIDGEIEIPNNWFDAFSSWNANPSVTTNNPTLQAV